MATNYRPLKPAPSVNGPHRIDKPTRSVSKRSAATKSACWGCRKRKAKCDGKRPACANCAKAMRECVYDAKARDTNTKALQLANRDLQEQLDAANLLLRQLASGAPEMSAPILEHLAGNKQPQEIVRALGIQGNRPAERRQDKAVYRLPSSQTLDSTSHYATAREDSYMPLSLPTPASSVTDMNGLAGLAQSPWHAPDTNSLGTPISGVLDDLPVLPEEVSTFESVAPSLALRRNAVRVHSYLQRSNSIADAPRSKRDDLLFLLPLFNRMDYLLSAPINDDMDAATLSLSSADSSAAATPYHFTDSNSSFSSSISNHLACHRKSEGLANTGQGLATFLRIHSNYRNYFGNLPLSSSIRANNYPPEVQDAQLRNFTVPVWAVTTLNTLPDPGGLREAFSSVYGEATRLLQEGVAVEKVIGTHPEIAGLFKQEEFDKSTLLSKWAVQMVHSVKLKGYDFTCFASMYIFWYLMRWMITPSPETYAAMPEWIRPTPNQLFTPHISMVDFTIWPAFRELVVQLPSMQEHMEWLIDLSNSIQCEWPYELGQALCKDERTGSIDLVELAKQHVWTLGCWSVGPTFRNYVLNADNYVNVRVESPHEAVSSWTSQVV